MFWWSTNVTQISISCLFRYNFKKKNSKCSSSFYFATSMHVVSQRGIFKLSLSWHRGQHSGQPLLAKMHARACFLPHFSSVIIHSEHNFVVYVYCHLCRSVLRWNFLLLSTPTRNFPQSTFFVNVISDPLIKGSPHWHEKNKLHSMIACLLITKWTQENTVWTPCWWHHHRCIVGVYVGNGRRPFCAASL